MTKDEKAAWDRARKEPNTIEDWRDLHDTIEELLGKIEALQQTVRTLTEFFRDIQSHLDGLSRPLSGAEPHIQEIVGKALAHGSVPSAAPQERER